MDHGINPKRKSRWHPTHTEPDEENQLGWNHRSAFRGSWQFVPVLSEKLKACDTKTSPLTSDRSHALTSSNPIATPILYGRSICTSTFWALKLFNVVARLGWAFKGEVSWKSDRKFFWVWAITKSLPSSLINEVASPVSAECESLFTMFWVG